MATSSGTYVGIDMSKDRLEIEVLGEGRVWQVDNTQERINELVKWGWNCDPNSLWWRPQAVVNAAGLGQFARALRVAC